MSKAARADFTIHRMTPRDAGLLGNVADDVFDGPITPATSAAYLAAPGHALFVALKDGIVVGQVRGIVHVQPDEPAQLYIDNLGVAPPVQRQGVATGLVRALLAWGRQRGCAGAWVATETENAEAMACYATLGFEQKTLAWFSRDIE